MVRLLRDLNILSMAGRTLKIIEIARYVIVAAAVVFALTEGIRATMGAAKGITAAD